MPDLPSADLDLDRFCTACGYNLRGIQSERRPECGTAYDFRQTSVTKIPWAHRRSIGQINAFARTVLLSTFRPKLIGLETQNPVSLADAKSFRRWVTLFAVPPWCWLFGQWYLNFTLLTRSAWNPQDVSGSLLQWGGFVVLELTVILWIFFCAGVPSYLFHPRDRSIVHQNRAIALSYYACGPMVFMSIPAVAIHYYVAGRWYEHRVHDPGPFWAVTIGSLILWIWQLDAIWKAPMRIFTVSTQAGRARRQAMDFFLPISWVVLFLLTVVALNSAYWLVAWMVMSYA